MIVTVRFIYPEAITASVMHVFQLTNVPNTFDDFHITDARLRSTRACLYVDAHITQRQPRQVHPASSNLAEHP
jgi:hypothetical protein